MLFWLIFPILMLLAIITQSAMPLHGDVSYLAHVTEQWLQGGTYGKDFFETNPPMILFLSIIPVTIAKYAMLSMALSFRLYLFTLIFFSCTCSYYLLQRVITEKYILNFLMIALSVVLLFLPANQFGQREHLFLILIMPYVFSAVCALQHVSIHRWIAILIGMAAGLGFALKPYFLFPLVFIEIYFIVHGRHWLHWIRLETGIILVMLVTYLGAIYLFYPTYFHLMLPLIHQFYLEGIEEPWMSIITSSNVLFCLLAASSYFIFRKETHYPILSAVLFIAVIGAMLSFLVTRTTWFYHMIPALGFSCLLLALLMAEFSRAWTKKEMFLLVILGGLIFYIPLQYVIQLSYLQTREAQVGGTMKLANYLRAQPGEHSVACFSANTTADCFPMVDETGSRYASRFPFFWWMRGMVATKTSPANQYMVEQVADDLQQLKPRFVIINLESEHYIFGDDFSFITYLSANDDFRAAFKPYQHVTTVDRYDIYERRSSH